MNTSDPQAQTLWWEDFPVGRTADLGSHTFDANEIIEFARQFDPQPFHTDPAAARSSIYGGLIASGWHTCAVAMRLMCDNYINRTVSMGSPGVDNIRWLKPVHTVCAGVPFGRPYPMPFNYPA